MGRHLRSASVPRDALRELDDLAAARGIALAGVCGGILWVLIGLALPLLHGPAELPAGRAAAQLDAIGYRDSQRSRP